MNNGQKPSVLVISAHAVDFVWRCGGTIARYAKDGSRVRILDLTFGERGESAEIWQSRPGITVDEVKRIRREEAEKASQILGAEIRFLDFNDHPLVMGMEHYLILVEELRDFQPQIVLTHHTEDPLNPDHPEVSAATYRALRCAQVPGVKPETTVTGPIKTFMFEPDQPEFCNFNPDVFIDITDVMDLKVQAMKVVASQTYLHENYTRRAEYRGYLAGRIAGDKNIKYAEAFKRFAPFVGKFFS
ncbi:PIG-L deacetylase family protein [Neomoorella mulderi]|uniref:4-oxalmesaconate hydratase n=1 Tax=Moorella mulderi DSM 14980 TaxID=1122241 RepID=A0A151AST3_9FIRM|nr:PIG-L deacetylase family protein [Moorella mulderi]KYH30686.1 4-oxalmesaconate hydratase [Moorella mulderi DSM 14980]